MNSRERWAGQAQYDLDTARAMLAAGRRLYVLFCCQQAVEKSPKGLLAERSQEHPPRIHNLVRLAERAGLVLPPALEQRMRMLSNYYIESRYPEELVSLGQIDHALADEMLRHTEEVLEWLASH